MTDRPLRLLDISVMWPPEYQPFITGRLRSLAAAGVDVWAAASSPGPIDSQRMPFARIVRLPHVKEPNLIVLSRTAAATARLLLLRPGLVPRMWSAGRKRSPTFKALVRWWADSVPLVLTNPDIIHFEWNSMASELEWLPAIMGVPFVVSCRGRQVNIVPYLPGSEGKKDELAQGFRSATLVHGVCRDILREAERLGMPPEKGRVVYTAVDVDFFRPPSSRVVSTGPLRLLNVGVSMWRKGYEYLLSALREALDSGVDASLEIADYDGPERDRLEYLIADLALSGKVTILGKIGPEQIKDALGRCDVFVLSALSEGISNAVIEAMACGVPVITTDCGGMREAVTDGVEGCVVGARDATAMAAAIERLASQPDVRKRMGEAGRARVLKDFGPNKQSKEFLKLYRDAIEIFRDKDMKLSTVPAYEETGRVGRSDGTQHAPHSAPDSDKRFIESPPIRVVTAADLHWRNGHEYAVEAIAELRSRGVPVHYTIVGNGPFLEAVGFARFELDLMETIDMELDAAREDEALSNTDVFLLAAVGPGAAHSLRKALDRGIPAVITDLPELETLVAGRPNCRIVPRRNKSALARAIEELARPVSPQAELAADPRGGPLV